MPKISNQAQPKKKKSVPSRAKLRWCNNCGIEITHSRGNRTNVCRACQDPKYLHHLEEVKLRQKLQRAGELPPPKPRNLTTPYQRKRPETYLSQQVSEDGRDFLVYVGNKLTPVPMLCRKCKRDNNQVRGHWGPIYGQYDANGNELYQVLLCRGCYDAECDKYEAQTIAS